MSLDRAPEWKKSKDSAEVQQPERIEVPDGLTGIIGTPFFRKPPAEFGLDEERTPFDLTHRGFVFTPVEWASFLGGVRNGEFGLPYSRLEYTPEGPVGTSGAIQRRLISDALGSPSRRAPRRDSSSGVLRSHPAGEEATDRVVATVGQEHARHATGPPAVQG
jgi:hypothetical protein